MKRVLIILLLLVIGISFFYQVKVKVKITPVDLAEDTSPLAVARLEMDLPASWNIEFYRSEIYFDFKSPMPQLTINELSLDESRGIGGNVNLDLFPEHQRKAQVYEGDTPLAAPPWLKRPFKGLAMAHGSHDSLMYVAAMKMDGFILHVSIKAPMPVKRSELNADFYQRHFEEQLTRIFEVYEADPDLREPTDFRTRFGRIKQNPEQYFVKQTVRVNAPGNENNYGAMVMSMGDCRNLDDIVCRSNSRFFEPYRQLGSLSDTLISLASGYLQQVLESGERNINGLNVYASSAIRKNVMPWNFDGGWDALVTCLYILSDPQTNKSGKVMVLISPEDMDGLGFDQRAYSHFYSTIMKVWSSIRSIS